MYAGRQKHSGQMHCDHFAGHILRYTGQTHTRTRNIQMKEREQMADHEMMNLEEMGRLRDSMELLGEELMNGHRINPNLYVEYDGAGQSNRRSVQAR